MINRIHTETDEPYNAVLEHIERKRESSIFLIHENRRENNRSNVVETSFELMEQKKKLLDAVKSPQKWVSKIDFGYWDKLLRQKSWRT